MTEHVLLFGISRFFHLTAVVVAIGGTFVLRYVVMPAVHAEGEDVRRRLHAVVQRRLGVIVPSAVGILLASGVINLVRAFTVAPRPIPAYHGLLGIKLLLALALFTVAVGLVLPSATPNVFQRQPRRWLSFNVHMGLLLIALSVALRFLSGK